MGGHIQWSDRTDICWIKSRAWLRFWRDPWVTDTDRYKESVGVHTPTPHNQHLRKPGIELQTYDGGQQKGSLPKRHDLQHDGEGHRNTGWCRLYSTEQRQASVSLLRVCCSSAADNPIPCTRKHPSGSPDSSGGFGNSISPAFDVNHDSGPSVYYITDILFT